MAQELSIASIVSIVSIVLMSIAEFKAVRKDKLNQSSRNYLIAVLILFGITVACSVIIYKETGTSIFVWK